MSEPSPVTILFVSADEQSGLPHWTALCQEGFAVCHAGTGAEALLRAAEAPALVIVDGHLPDLSGPEVCRRLKACPQTAAVPVLRLCPPTEGEGEDEAAGWDGLADGWLRAPSPRTLLAQIKALLRARGAERALRDSEALYHSLVETLPVCIIRKDLRGRFTFANQPFCTELHRPLEDIVGCTDYDFYPTELAEKYSHDDRRVMDTATVFEDVEEHTVEGQKNYVHVLKGPLHDSRGRVIGLQSVFWDVTARKRAEAEVERTATEMGVARRIQQKFFPGVAPRLVGGGAAGCRLDLGGASYPADEIGGDYFDYLPLPDGALGVAIGDVSGHGIGPALLMAIARAYLRACAEAEADVGAILGRVNRLLAPDIEGDRYITMLLARIDPEARSLIYASAGHATGYVLGPTGEVKHALESTTLPLGIASHTSFPPGAPVALAEGDLVLLLTDGVVESRDPHGHPFGAQRVLDMVHGYRAASARQIVENIYQGVRAFAQNMPQDDDITATVIKIGPNGPGQEVGAGAGRRSN